MQDISSVNEVDRNFEAFQKILPDLLAGHAGKFAVMHRGEVVDFFDSIADAAKFGLAKYERLSEFSIQEVTSSAESLGYYSYAVHKFP